MACFQPSLHDNKLVSCFQSKISCQISILTLKPFSLSKIDDLTCSDPEFERFLLR